MTLYVSLQAHIRDRYRYYPKSLIVTRPTQIVGHMIKLRMLIMKFSAVNSESCEPPLAQMSNGQAVDGYLSSQYLAT